MKNADKIINALRLAFPGHAVEYQYKPTAKVNSIFIDRVYIGSFEDGFFEEDFDNPEIEIKVKAPIKSIKEFIDFASNYETIRGALERGFAKWENESHPNN